jgi:tetratricopeptide (TPR) repeat protein
MALFDVLLRWLIPDLKGKTPDPSGNEKIELRASGQASFAPSSTIANTTAVMIADFHGPQGDVFAEHLVSRIDKMPGIAILRRKEPLRLTGLGDEAEKVTATAEQGRAWLQETGAGLLIWGAMTAESSTATLRFLPAVTEPDGTLGALGPADAFDVPADLGGESGQVIAAMVLAATAFGHGARDGFAIVGLRRMLHELSDPEALAAAGSPAVAASLMLGVGHAHAAEYRSAGDPARLDLALACYRAASERVTVPTHPRLWIQSQNHLANLLVAQAEAERSPSRMNDAATVCRQATEALTRIEYSSDWAQFQARLGAVLYRLGQMEGKPAHFRDAATAYQQALTVFTQPAHPLRWSDLMHQYGVLLTTLGEHMTGTAALEQAVMVFHKALNVRRRETLPLHWAQTTSALGATSFALAKRNGNAAALREAVGCFEGALDIYGQLGQGQAIAVLQKNLQRARRLLETRGAALADDVAPKDTASAKTAPALTAKKK